MKYLLHKTKYYVLGKYCLRFSKKGALFIEIWALY